VRRLAFLKSLPPKRSRRGLLISQPDDAELQNLAGNMFQHISWAIADNLEVSP